MARNETPAETAESQIYKGRGNTSMKHLALFLLLTAITVAGVVNYTYDAAGRLVKVDYGNGGSIVYTYDSAGNLTSRTTVSAASVKNSKKAAAAAAKKKQ